MSSETNRPEQYVLPTQQERSRATLDRILDATESLLQERLFDDITIAAIVERAGCSVGAFYSRVRTKDALLKYLRERLYADIQQQLGANVDVERWASVPIVERVRLVARMAVDNNRDKLGVLRTVVLQAQRDEPFRIRGRAFQEQILQTVVTFWTLNPADIHHSDQAAAARFGFVMLNGLMREAYLFGEMWPDFGQRDEAAFVEQIVSAVMGYLQPGVPQTAPQA